MPSELLATSAFLSLISQSRAMLSVDALWRLLVGRDPGTGVLVWTYGVGGSPVPVGMKEVVFSVNGLSGDTEVVIVESQALFDQLDMIDAEVNEVGRVLVAIHKTGSHMATVGVVVPYVRNVDVLVCTDMELGTWRRYDATLRSRVSGVQLLADDMLGVRIGRKLGVVTIDTFVTAVQRGGRMSFDEHATIEISSGAVLPPRMIDVHGQLAPAYVDGATVYIGRQSADGGWVMDPHHFRDDEMGATLPYATIDGGKVDGYCGFMSFDRRTGACGVQRNVYFSNAFRRIKPAASVAELQQPGAK